MKTVNFFAVVFVSLFRTRHSIAFLAYPTEQPSMTKTKGSVKLFSREERIKEVLSCTLLPQCINKNQKIHARHVLGSPDFLPHPLLALLLAPFFARSLTIVPPDFLCSETARKRLLSRLHRILSSSYYFLFASSCLK